MIPPRSAFGLASDVKSQLLQRLANRTATRAPAAGPAPRPPLGDPQVREELRRIREAGDILAIDNPFFHVHEGLAGAETIIGNRTYLNFASYNYLGLNGDPRVIAAAHAAMQRYGTSVSASRLVAGERPIHRDLEAALAAHHHTEDCLALVSGHATNVTAIGHLVGRGDAIVHDALAHNSVVQGALLSGAHRVAFPHNDPAALDRALANTRARKTLVVIEGHYSMDGDTPDLAAIAAITRRHGAWLMVDEAHSLGVLGPTGAGIAEHTGTDPSCVDIWMGTLSKTLSGCGGYIAASRDIVSYLRESAPGFVYSVGLSPPVAAAALECLNLVHAEPWRVTRLHENAALFLDLARSAGLDTGASIGAAIIPVIIGSSIKTARAADLLLKRGYNILPILQPAVPERAARLRFFLSALHTPEQIRRAVAATAEAVAEVTRMKSEVAAVAMGLIRSGRASND